MGGAADASLASQTLPYQCAALAAAGLAVRVVRGERGEGPGSCWLGEEDVGTVVHLEERDDTNRAVGHIPQGTVDYAHCGYHSTVLKAILTQAQLHT